MIDTIISYKPKAKKIKTLSLFSGCGGLDLGIMGGFSVHKKAINSNIKGKWIKVPKTPFEVIWANDVMPQAKKVWENNFTGEYVLTSIIDLLKENYKFPKVDLIIGGFPCQDFSVAGKRKGFKTERGRLYKAMAEVIKRVKPKAFIAENVFGLLSIKGAKEQIVNDFKKLGYQVYVYIVNAEYYGIPQARKRVFFIGLKTKQLKKKIFYDDLLPKPTHKKSVTLADVFSDLEEPELTSNAEQKAYSKAKWYGKKCQGNKEIDLNAVGPTIRAEHHGNIEFRRLSATNGGKYTAELKKGMLERRLTIRECARIQTFPDEFCFVEDKKGNKIIEASPAYRVIGNAVPPLLAYHFAKKLAANWDKLL